MNRTRRYTALLKNSHFWYIAIIMAGCSAFYYAPSIMDYMGWPKGGWDILYYGVHDPERALFLIPVLYAAYRFRLRGVIATTLISMAVFLPRALSISPYPDSLTRAMVFVGVTGAIGILATKLFDSIAEQKKAGAKIQEAERVWHNSFNSLDDVMLIISKDYSIEDINDKGLMLLGKSKEEVIGRKCYKTIHNTDKPMEFCPFRKSLTTKVVESVDRYEEVFGKYFSIKSSPMFDESGEVVKFVDLMRDITERKRVEEEFRQSEQRYRTLVEGTHDIIFSLDKDGRFTNLSPSFEEITGHLCRDFIGRSFIEVIAPEYIESTVSRFRQGLSGETIPIYEIEVLLKNGGRLSLELNVTSLFDTEGQTIGRIGIARNITERKLAEAELRIKDMALASPISAIAITDLGTNLTYVNSSFLELWGYDNESEVLGRPISEFSQIGEHVTAAMEALSKKEEGWIGQSVGKRKDGSPFDIQLSTSLVKDKAGKPIGILGSFIDITERKRAEEELKKSEQKYHDLLYNANDLIQYVGPDARIIFVNKKWLETLEYSEEEVKNLKVTDILHENQIARIMGLFKGTATGRTVKNIKATFISKYGKEIYVEGNGRGVIEDGKFTGAIGIFRDITERKQAEEKIKASLAEKELLLKEVHHRVKNNMQVISSLLKLGAASVKNKEDAAVFKDSQNHIKSMALVYNKLYQAEDLAHIDFGEYVGDLIRNLVPSYKSVSGKVTTSVEGNGVSLGVDQAIPCGLVINELLTNSLKYAFPGGRGGEIRVSLAENEGEVELTVSDNGVGILASLDLAGSKTLGLRLVGNLVEQLGGKIEMDRTAGARFRITFRKSQG